MIKNERENLRRFVSRWREKGEFLEKLKLREFRRSNLEQTILSLSDASDSALKFYPPKPTSGLIEMQKLFAKIKK